jgi:hypothetical protein
MFQLFLVHRDAVNALRAEKDRSIKEQALRFNDRKTFDRFVRV